MITKSVRVSLGLGLLVCAWSLGAKAQSCTTTVTCAIYSLLGSSGGCIPLLPATAYNGVSDGPDEWIATVKTNSCYNFCWRCAAQAASPIDLATGDTYFTQTDLRLPGLGGGLTLTRTWDSIWPVVGSNFKVGMFGSKWRSTFEETVFAASDGYVSYMARPRSLEPTVDIAQLPRASGESGFAGPGGVGQAVQFRELFLLQQLCDRVAIFLQRANIRCGIKFGVGEPARRGSGWPFLIRGNRMASVTERQQ
jgi:hypothetical protein